MLCVCVYVCVHARVFSSQDFGMKVCFPRNMLPLCNLPLICETQNQKRQVTLLHEQTENCEDREKIYLVSPLNQRQQRR